MTKQQEPAKEPISGQGTATLQPAQAILPPPFLNVPGLVNLRDIGGYPIASAPGKVVRKHIIYRSGEPSRLTVEGEEKLRQLGITTVYDLRSQQEIDKITQNGHGHIREWEGAQRVYAPVFMELDYSPEALATRFAQYASRADEGFAHAYATILEAASAKENPFKPYHTILNQLASPTLPAPMLIHCTAGKDRTGLICALVLGLCGVEDEVISEEYNLTEVGLKERHREITAFILKDPEFRHDPEGAKRMLGARKESMMATLKMIREQYGTIEDCVLKLDLLSAEGIEQLRSNLIVDTSEY